MQIQWVGFDRLSTEERDAVEERLRRLDRDDGDLLSVRISAKSSRHHRHGSQQAHIASLVRRREIVASRERPDLALALNEALDDFEREVHGLRERLRDERERRPVLPPHLGIVERVLAAQGYGFVLTDAGERVYFHRNAVSGGLEFATLREGQRVGLQVEAGEKGLQAASVVPLPPGAPVV